jgi:hypothetical protein
MKLSHETEDTEELRKIWEQQALYRYEQLRDVVRKSEDDGAIARAAARFVVANEKLVELKGAKK